MHTELVRALPSSRKRLRPSSVGKKTATQHTNTQRRKAQAMEDEKETPREFDAHTPAQWRDTRIGLAVAARHRHETPEKPEQSGTAVTESYCQLLPIFFDCK